MSEEIKNNVSENSENISTVTETARATPETTETPAFEPAPLSATSNKNMIKCKTCGTEIARSAKACPSCGAKNKKPIYKRVWFWALIAIVLLIVISNTGGDDNKNADSSGIKVSVGTPVINGTTTAPKETTTKADPKATLAEAQKLLKDGNAIGAFDLANTLEKTDEVNAFLEECRKPILAEFDGRAMTCPIGIGHMPTEQNQDSTPLASKVISRNPTRMNPQFISIFIQDLSEASATTGYSPKQSESKVKAEQWISL